MIKSPLDTIAARDIGASPTRGAVAAYQLATLRETAEYARARSRFYREKLRDCDEIRALSDLARLPFTHPPDLAADPNAFMCLPPDAVARAVTLPTSGTTGAPKRLFFTADELERTIDFFAHGMTAITEKRGTVAVLMPANTPASVADLLITALARTGCVGVALGVPSDRAEMLRRVNDSRADCVVGLPSHVFALARTGDAPRVRSVLLCSDYVSDAVVRAIEKTWNCSVFTHYGLTESGYGGAVMCAARDGMHMRETDLLVEIIDPITGAPLHDGKSGEIVLTTLTRRAQPLIRYRTGDIARVIPEICACGSALRRLDRVLGRIGGGVTLADGARLTMPQLDEIVYAVPDVAAFDAVLSGNSLKITTDGGDTDAVRDALKALPQLHSVEVRVVAGAVPFRGVAKRDIAVDRV
ncbi:MAG: AMP-binding protein [Oscillospiraceae bacterium]|jgi:phenylacetate-coenzyme A ligase PaaK-like adenylate-forming protein|nr:AMP-binding protein [Oscillospiraceae bacterium]